MLEVARVDEDDDLNADDQTYVCIIHPLTEIEAVHHAEHMHRVGRPNHEHAQLLIVLLLRVVQLNIDQRALQDKSANDE